MLIHTAPVPVLAGPRPCDEQRRILVGDGRGEPGEPVIQAGPLLSVHELVAETPDHSAGALGVPGCEGVMECLLGELVLVEPASGTRVKSRDLVRAALAFQTIPQQILERVVEAIPSSSLVERDREQAVCLETFHERPSVEARLASVAFRSTDHLAERSAEAAQNGGPEQPLLLSGGQPGQDLLDEVLLHLGGRPFEIAQEGLRVAPGAQGQRDEPQTDRPALDHLLQVVERPFTQRHARVLREKELGLRSVELEILETHLGELASASQRGQGQRRIAPRDHDQVEALRRVHQQLGEQIVNCRAVDVLVVVQDQDERGLDRVQLVCEAAREHRDRR